MRYTALHGNGFYRKTETELYLKPVDFRLMSNDQLLAEVDRAVTVYEQWARAQAKKRQGRFRIYMAAVGAVVGGAAMAASNSASAGGAAVNSAGALPSSTAQAAAGSSAQAAGASKLKGIATYLKKIGPGLASATGNDPTRIDQAADLIQSGSWQKVIEKGVEHVLKEEGAEIAQEDKDANNALKEVIRRESEAYASKLKKLADQQAEQKALPIETLDAKKKNTLETLAIAAPLLYMVFSK